MTTKTTNRLFFSVENIFFPIMCIDFTQKIFVFLHFQAYSALGSADRPWLKEGSLTSGLPTTGYEVLNHPMIVYLAWKHGKTTANIGI